VSTSELKELIAATIAEGARVYLEISYPPPLCAVASVR